MTTYCVVLPNVEISLFQSLGVQESEYGQVQRVLRLIVSSFPSKSW
jgi:hypothetical protein